MANVTSSASPSNQNTEQDDQVSDVVKDVIPVLQKLTKQLGKATQEWVDLNKVYQELTTVLREHIRVMEKNNEYHHYWLLLDHGKHHGATRSNGIFGFPCLTFDRNTAKQYGMLYRESLGYSIDDYITVDIFI